MVRPTVDSVDGPDVLWVVQIKKGGKWMYNESYPDWTRDVAREECCKIRTEFPANKFRVRPYREASDVR